MQNFQVHDNGHTQAANLALSIGGKDEDSISPATGLRLVLFAGMAMNRVHPVKSPGESSANKH